MTGFLGSGKTLQQWDLNGNCIADFATTGRTEDIALSPNGRYLAAIHQKSRLAVFDLSNREQDYEIEIADKLGSVAISRDSKTILVGTKDGEARLVNIRTHELLNTFSGQASTQFVIRSSFGGAHDSFITSGSEGKTA